MDDVHGRVIIHKFDLFLVYLYSFSSRSVIARAVTALLLPRRPHFRSNCQLEPVHGMTIDVLLVSGKN